MLRPSILVSLCCTSACKILQDELLQAPLLMGYSDDMPSLLPTHRTAPYSGGYIRLQFYSLRSCEFVDNRNTLNESQQAGSQVAGNAAKKHWRFAMSTAPAQFCQ